MHRSPAASLVVVLALASACRDHGRPGPSSGSAAVAPAPATLAANLHPLSFRAPYAAADLAFLRDAVGTRSIVQLGESIHITDEFPRARLSVVRYLHEELGFDVLAFEGSAIDAWLAEDGIYHSHDAPAVTARRAQRSAWFALWDTEAMGAIMAYVVASHATPSPLYLASFDLQPGNTKPFGGSASAALAALLDTIASYAVQPATAKSWVAAIAPALKCWKTDPEPTARRAAIDAIDQLSRWITTTSPAVALKTSKFHAAALARVPAMLRAGIEMCTQVAAAPVDHRQRVYQESRDQQNATLAIALRDDVSLSHRVILWAHHSHVNHNTLGANIPSMGQHLHEARPDALYTIGLFAGSGTAMSVDDDACPPIQPKPIVGFEKFGGESLLAAAAGGDFFLNLAGLDSRDASLAAWFAPSTTRMEASGQLKTVLARDFDGAIFVREVHSVELQSIPAATRALMSLECAAGNKVH